MGTKAAKTAKVAKAKSAKVVKAEVESLVLVQRHEPITTSLIVAEAFGKRHDSVIRAVRNLGCSEDFRRHNFKESSYQNEQNKEQPMFNMTESGFQFLVMGFSGKRAAAWKEKYIAAFKAMRAALQRQHNEEWQQARLAGKEMRSEFTAAIQAFVEYAKAQGSQHAEMYYVNLTKAVNKALFIVGQDAPQPFRNLLNGLQLAGLVVAEDRARCALLEGMEKGLPYKDIYVLARDRVTVLALAIGATPVPLLVAAPPNN